MKNLKLSDSVLLSIELRVIDVAFWRCIWNFLRSPTEHRLFAIEIPSINFVLTLVETQSNKRNTSKLSHPPDLLKAFEPYLRNVKSIEHPLWQNALPWIHRLRFLCHFVHLMGIKIWNITLDVREQGKEKNIVSVQVNKLVQERSLL